jgi:hypothetical protein
MPAMPAQAGAHLTKLDLLLQQAGVRARRALIGTRQQLRPLLHMIHADGKESVAGVPWAPARRRPRSP